MISKNNVIHIIGGGGVGMSALARLLVELGYQVTASDSQASTYLTELASCGVQTWVGSHPEKIKKNSVVFYSTAISRNDPERNYVRQNNIPEHPRQPLLSFLTKEFYTIAVSGTHGKTTTSAWLTFLLQKAGFDPTSLLGGKALNWENNFISGKGTIDGKPLLVIEADESDNSFLSLAPKIAIVTNIEMDHPDQHSSFKSIQDAFFEFISKLNEGGGKLIASIESTKSILDLGDDSIGITNQSILNDIKLDSVHNTIQYKGVHYEIGLRGIHNLYNATCVISLSELLGIQTSVLKGALYEFQGVARRMQTIYHKVIHETKSITIMDDYAHHPKEVLMTLQTVKKEYDYFLVVWEPHRISRFDYFFDDFYNVFDQYCGWNRLFLLPTFSTGEKVENFPSYEKKIAKLQSRAINSKDAINFEEIYNRLQEKGRSILVFLGAGKSSDEAHSFVKFCETYNA